MVKQRRKRGGYEGAELKALIEKGSYQGKKKVGDYELDKSLSTGRAKVYVNPKTGKTVVAHQGTQGFTDWGNNLVYAVGGSKLYKKTDRYKEAARVQKAAEKKYGTVSTIGHSQGGLLAELVGGKGEVTTVNKAAHPYVKGKTRRTFDLQAILFQNLVKEVLQRNQNHGIHLQLIAQIILSLAVNITVNKIMSLTIVKMQQQQDLPSTFNFTSKK